MIACMANRDPLIEPSEPRFHGWRLLAVVLLVVAVIAGISALVDWIVLGRIEGGL